MPFLSTRGLTDSSPHTRRPVHSKHQHRAQVMLWLACIHHKTDENCPRSSSEKERRRPSCAKGTASGAEDLSADEIGQESSEFVMDPG